MKRPKRKFLPVYRINQRRHTLPHWTTGSTIVLLKSDKKTWSVKEHQLFRNYAEEYETFLPGGWTHYVVLPTWLR